MKSSTDYGAHGLPEGVDQRSPQVGVPTNLNQQKYFKLHNDSLYAYNGAFDTFN